MDPATFHRSILRPGLEGLYELGGPPVTRAAERMLLAIAGQEADWRLRYQHSPAETPGPARGWFQFEPSGVNGVLTHAASRQLAEAVCREHWVVRHTGAIACS